MVDPSGAFPMLLRRVRKFIEKIAIAIVVVFIKIKEDIDNANIDNGSEQVVLDSHYFSFYKGNLVIRHSIPYVTSWAILHTVFLNRNESNIRSVQHEWGHTQQEEEIGTSNYIFYIALPSLYGYFTTPKDEYYSQPWERSADIYGGVKRYSNQYPMTDEEAMKYLKKIRRLPITLPIFN
jgi:hypothetical protein